MANEHAWRLYVAPVLHTEWKRPIRRTPMWTVTQYAWFLPNEGTGLDDFRRRMRESVRAEPPGHSPRTLQRGLELRLHDQGLVIGWSGQAPAYDGDVELRTTAPGWNPAYSLELIRKTLPVRQVSVGRCTSITLAHCPELEIETIPPLRYVRHQPVRQALLRLIPGA